MAFPTVASVTPSIFDVDATSHLVAMPATVEAGDLLVSYFTNDTAATVATPTDWDFRSSQFSGSAARLSSYVKLAVGTEGGTTVDHVTSTAEQGTAQVYRIPAASWSGVLADVVVTTLGGAGTTPNPPLLSPAAGAQDYLWIAAEGHDVNTAVTAYPASYTDGTSTLGGTTSGTGMGTARRELNAASEDPGNFTIAVFRGWIAHTLAVPPTTAEAHTGGSEATVTVDGEGAGTKGGRGGAESVVTADGEAGGDKAGAGGSDADVEVDGEGAGAKHGQSGSTALVEVSTTGGGFNPEDIRDGSTAVVEVSATGGGTAFDPDRPRLVSFACRVRCAVNNPCYAESLH